MHVLLATLSAILPVFALPATTPQYHITDVWQTTWDRSALFSHTTINHSSDPTSFTSAKSPSGNASITIDDASPYQPIWGFGASLTDSSAKLLNDLKGLNPSGYRDLLRQLFDPTESADAAGFSYLRVPLGASDFAAKEYSYDDVDGDTSFKHFNINAAPSYVFSTIKDIKSINPNIKMHLVPWSPPGWMKTNNSMYGGSLQDQYVGIYATYLVKCVQGFSSHGIKAFAVSIQNEPQYSNPTYPSTIIPVATEAQIGGDLRKLLDASSNLSDVAVIGYEHNWDDAGQYPVQLMQEDGDAFHGVAFHCYAGDSMMQELFYKQDPTKPILLTECSGTIGTDWWTDIKWYMDNLFIGAITNNARTGLMWNLALDGTGQPQLPGSNSCAGGCRGVVQINDDGTYSLNQEFYAMAHASKATLPASDGGPPSKRIGVSINGSMSDELIVGAYVTATDSSGDSLRYSLVVLNQADGSDDGDWNPQPIQATISFRGTQATYTFPVGVTTLMWSASNEGDDFDDDFLGSLCPDEEE